jgi:glutathione S-transferase
VSAARPYRFYAAEISYFSAKVRPALRYKGVHYLELAPDYRHVILPRTGLAFIPIVVTPEDETWQDTSEILDRLEARLPSPPLYPTTPAQRIAAYVLELYADEFMLLPAMHYRWSFEESVTKARADFVAVAAEPETSARFADRMRGSLPFLGVTPATAPAIEAHLVELLARLSDHFRVHPFLLGARMSLADCALMGPLYAHLYLDAVPGRLLRATAPEVCRWIERMNRPDPDAPGTWLPDDALAPTLLPILRLVGRDAIPLVLAGARAFEAWVDAQATPPDELPRGVGGHATALRGVALERFTSAYTPWMVQRPLDAFHALAGSEQAAVTRAFAGTGCEELLAYAPRHRVGKRQFKLVLARDEQPAADRRPA